ncbi:hypothetical protein Efla_005101 [Eimeria flavescens]
MDTLIGLRGKDFAVVAADKYACSSIVRMKNDEDKVLPVDDDKLLALSGEVGDRVQFGEYIRKNIHLYRLRSNIKLSTTAAAQFARQQLAHFLRKSPYHVNMMVAGCDEEGASLFWVDYLASMVPVEKGAHGYASYFVEGLLDRWYREDITEEDALEILKKCKHELTNRFLVSQTDFVVKIVNKNGIREVEI